LGDPDLGIVLLSLKRTYCLRLAHTVPASINVPAVDANAAVIQSSRRSKASASGPTMTTHSQFLRET
jgi:hypothetical protein